MDTKNPNEELQSRREFFKKAAKAALPVVGAVVLASLPIVKSEAATDCLGNCGNSCSLDCSGGCRGGCQESCYSGCRNTCHGTCSGGCAKNAYA